MDRQLKADNAEHEPLLMENKDRFVLFPIQHNDIWQFYKSTRPASGPPRRST